MNHPISKKGVKPITHTDQIRSMLLRKHGSDVDRVYIFAARFACGVALNEAERAGREFSPLYWFVTDDNEIIMTLWDMTNDQT
jgi:hypothetical protein